MLNTAGRCVLKIAVIGGGVSGLLAARLLSTSHQVTLFEATDRLGGHGGTHAVSAFGRSFAIDTGLLAFHRRANPRTAELIDQLGIPTRPLELSFSARMDASGIEYGTRGLRGIFS